MPAGGLQLRLERTLDANPERVFRALSEPAELARWWGPRGFTIPGIELDLRVGGRFRIAMKPPEGEPFHLYGEFLEVRRPERLSYTFNWDPPDADDRETVATLSLRAVNGSTELQVEQGAFATEARLALHQEGWGDSLDRLREFLSGN